MMLSIIRQTLDGVSLLQLSKTDGKQSSGGQDVRSPGAWHGRHCAGAIVFHPVKIYCNRHGIRFSLTDNIFLARKRKRPGLNYESASSIFIYPYRSACPQPGGPPEQNHIGPFPQQLPTGNPDNQPALVRRRSSCRYNKAG